MASRRYSARWDWCFNNEHKAVRVVFDTNILVAAARSRQGASFALIHSIPSAAFELCLSVSLYVEWQAVLTRKENLPPDRTEKTHLAFFVILPARRICRRSISYGGRFFPTLMMTWCWNWRLPQVVAILLP